ncbi:MAG: biopolymer transporter ExbD [Polyangiaceae bacterium]|nr:biopolymer transporter ExbD [Polyangiaceae bacterium]
MGMSLGGGSGKDGPKPVVNVTPLVDVTLVVLIIFMVVTPLMTKTFWLNLPPKDDQEQKEKPPPSEQNQPLVMTVDKAGTIRVNQTVLAKAEIAERLPRMLAAKKQKVLYFDAHDEAPYGHAVAAMDLSRAAGARSIAILTQPVVK